MSENKSSNVLENASTLIILIVGAHVIWQIIKIIAVVIAFIICLIYDFVQKRRQQKIFKRIKDGDWEGIAPEDFKEYHALEDREQRERRRKREEEQDRLEKERCEQDPGRKRGGSFERNFPLIAGIYGQDVFQSYGHPAGRSPRYSKCKAVLEDIREACLRLSHKHYLETGESVDGRSLWPELWSAKIEIKTDSNWNDSEVPIAAAARRLITELPAHPDDWQPLFSEFPWTKKTFSNGYRMDKDWFWLNNRKWLIEQVKYGDLVCAMEIKMRDRHFDLYLDGKLKCRRADCPKQVFPLSSPQKPASAD